MLLVGGVGGWLVAVSGGSGVAGVGDVLLTSGGTVVGAGGSGATEMGGFEKELGSDVSLPMTAADAVSAGWEDPFLCSSGRGRYFQNKAVEVPAFLMFNYEDRLIGVYLASESEMPSPWRLTEELSGGGGILLIEEDHWGLFVYFQDPTRACRTPKQALGARVDGGRGFLGEREYEPPPTPTPMPALGQALEGAISKLAALTPLSITLASEPDGLPFAEDIQSGEIGDIVKALEGPTDTPSKWIDNRPHRGILGTVPGGALKAIVPLAKADARVGMQIWLNDTGAVRRVRLEGPVAADDPPEAVRVLELGDFK